MEKKFDLVVHKRDKKGQIYMTDDYRLVIDAGVQYFERPPGSGFIYAANGDLIREPAPVVEAAPAAPAELELPPGQPSVPAFEAELDQKADAKSRLFKGNK